MLEIIIVTITLIVFFCTYILHQFYNSDLVLLIGAITTLFLFVAYPLIHSWIEINKREKKKNRGEEK